MTKFLSKHYTNMKPYLPGEHPNDREYIKLNQNESPFPPSSAVRKALSSSVIDSLNRYEDPYCLELRETIADVYALKAEQIFVGNGSDEVLSFLFQTFFDEVNGIAFTDITYDFYQCYCSTFNVNYELIPLKEDFSYDLEKFMHTKNSILLANPNAPTGMIISLDDIENLLAVNPDRLVIIDEAYVDFDNQTCLPLLEKYSNLIVVQTFSKSRNLASGRIGFAAASKELVDDLRDVKFSFSPLNLSSLSIAIGCAAAKDTDYLKQCTNEIIQTRKYFENKMKNLGFSYLDSHTNFLFVTHPSISAEEYCRKLQDNGILARWYSNTRIKNYLRISIGTKEDMDKVLQATEKILRKNG